MWKFMGGLPEVKLRVQLTGARGKWSVKQGRYCNEHVFEGTDGSHLRWSIGESPQFSDGNNASSRLKQAFWASHEQLEKRHDRAMQRSRSRPPGLLKRP